MSTDRRQLDLFSAVLHAYSAENAGRLSNAILYEQVATHVGVASGSLREKEPVGKSGQLHSLAARQIRWHQQTLKHAGILERLDGERGIWQLTEPAGKDLNKIGAGVAVVGFSTDLGIAILGTCESVFSKIDAPISLIITSPPAGQAAGVWRPLRTAVCGLDLQDTGTRHQIDGARRQPMPEHFK